MLVRQMLEIYDLLDTPQASGEAVAGYCVSAALRM